MLFVRLRETLVELPTANHIERSNGHVTFTDTWGATVARFKHADVLAWSPDRETLARGFAADAAPSTTPAQA